MKWYMDKVIYFNIVWHYKRLDTARFHLLRAGYTSYGISTRWRTMQVFKKWRSPLSIQISRSPGHAAKWKTRSAKHSSPIRSYIPDTELGHVICYSHWENVMHVKSELPEAAWISTSLLLRPSPTRRTRLRQPLLLWPGSQKKKDLGSLQVGQERGCRRSGAACRPSEGERKVCSDCCWSSGIVCICTE